MSRIVAICAGELESVPGVSQECKAVAKAAAATQALPTIRQPGRTTTQLPSLEASEVLGRGTY